MSADPPNVPLRVACRMHDDEDRCERDLHHEGRPVGRRHGRRRGNVCLRGGKQQEERCEDRARELADPVADELEGAEAPVEEHRQRDRRIEMTARHLAERVEAADQRQSEGERHGEQHRLIRPDRGDDGRRSPEDEDEGAEPLRQVPLPELHFPHLPSDRNRSRTARLVAAVRIPSAGEAKEWRREGVADRHGEGVGGVIRGRHRVEREDRPHHLPDLFLVGAAVAADRLLDSKRASIQRTRRRRTTRRRARLPGPGRRRVRCGRRRRRTIPPGRRHPVRGPRSAVGRP